MFAELELEFYYQNASTADATIDVPIANTISKQRLHLIASWLDLSSILLYLVMVLFIILYQQRVLEEVSAQTVTVTDYSVQVWDLPKVHISAIGSIHQQRVIVGAKTFRLLYTSLPLAAAHGESQVSATASGDVQSQPAQYAVSGMCRDHSQFWPSSAPPSSRARCRDTPCLVHVASA